MRLRQYAIYVQKREQPEVRPYIDAAAGGRRILKTDDLIQVMFGSVIEPPTWRLSDDYFRFFARHTACLARQGVGRLNPLLITFSPINGVYVGIFHGFQAVLQRFVLSAPRPYRPYTARRLPAIAAAIPEPIFPICISYWLICRFTRLTRLIMWSATALPV